MLKNAGLIKISPSVNKISKYDKRPTQKETPSQCVCVLLLSSRFVSGHGEVYGLQRDVNTLFDDASFKLPLKELEHRFTEMPIEILHPLLEGG